MANCADTFITIVSGKITDKELLAEIEKIEEESPNVHCMEWHTKEGETSDWVACCQRWWVSDEIINLIESLSLKDGNVFDINCEEFGCAGHEKRIYKNGASEIIHECNGRHLCSDTGIEDVEEDELYCDGEDCTMYNTKTIGEYGEEHFDLMREYQKEMCPKCLAKYIENHDK